MRGYTTADRIEALEGVVSDVRDVLEWVREQRRYCRPPELADATAEEVDARRGPCAAYGDTVYGLVEDRLSRALDGAP